MKSARWYLVLIVVLTIVVVVSVTAIDEINERLAYKLTQSVLNEYQGSFGSIPLWPFGSEYRISICDQTVGDAELAEISQIDGLGKHGIYRRNWVGIAFVDTNLAQEDLQRLRLMFPHCTIFITATENQVTN